MKTFDEILFAAERGDVNAQLELGRKYSKKGGAQNKREAYIWLYIAMKDIGERRGVILLSSWQANEAKAELKELTSPTHGTPEELSVFEDIEPLKQEAEKRYEEIQERIKNEE